MSSGNSLVQRNQVDLVEFVDWTGVKCLNHNSLHTVVNALKQRLVVVYHSNVNDYPLSDTVVLTPENLQGKPSVLKFVKFQNVRSLTVFIEDNQSDSELTKVHKIELYGTTVETTDMKGLEKIEDH